MDGGLPASLSPTVHGLLRTDLGFDGVVMTDDLAMEAVAAYSADGAVAVMADAWLDGEDLPPTVCYAVDVQAEITCRDGVFTVQAFYLNVLED